MDRKLLWSGPRRALAYLRDGRVPLWKRGLGVLALAYLFSPIDVVPDAIPLLGWLDDVGVLGTVAAFLWRDIQRRTAEPQAVQAGGEESGG